MMPKHPFLVSTLALFIALSSSACTEKEKIDTRRAACKALLKQSVAGDAEAMLEVATRYDEGECDSSMHPQPIKAEKWYRRAAQAGLPKAEEKLGELFLTGRILQQSEVNAAAWYKKAADHGLVSAQLQYALMLQSGTGMKKDSKAGLAMLKQVAKNGSADAQFKVGVAQLQGWGTEKSPEAALKSFVEAAKRGHTSATATAAYMYDKGIGGEADADKAIKWYSSAAKQEDLSSLKRLGNLFEESDPARSLFYWSILKEYKHTDAELKVAKLEKRLSDKKQVAVKSKVTAWMSQYSSVHRSNPLSFFQK